MSTTPVNVLVTVTETDTPVPTGQTFASLALVLTDAGGVVATQNVKAAPWVATFTAIAPGAGSVTATALDILGATLGTPMTQAFNTGVATGLTFPQPTAVSVTLA